MTLYHIGYVNVGKTPILLGTNGVIGDCLVGYKYCHMTKTWIHDLNSLHTYIW
jgi:hypothetical protein